MLPTRDSIYYGNNCNLVLQVENVLFKVEMFRLAAHSEAFANMVNVPTGPNDTEGASDANPVMLPQIQAEEFRNLLYVFYQSPVDPKYISFMAGASNKKNHTPAVFKRYLDIAQLAHRFCMAKVEVWAKQQLQGLQKLNSAMGWLDLSHLVTTLTYAKLSGNGTDDTFVQSTKTSLSYVISRPNGGPIINFYKKFSMNTEPMLRGPLLIHMLKLGHEPWISSKLSWEERGPLYALQAHLVPLPDTPPFITLSESENIEATLMDEAGRNVRLCSSVLASLRSAWETLIITRKWQSTSIEDAVGELNDLPLARRELRGSLEACTCQGRNCDDLLLKHIDQLIEALYNEVVSICRSISSW